MLSEGRIRKHAEWKHKLILEGLHGVSICGHAPQNLAGTGCQHSTCTHPLRML